MVCGVFIIFTLFQASSNGFGISAKYVVQPAGIDSAESSLNTITEVLRFAQIYLET